MILLYWKNSILSAIFHFIDGPVLGGQVIISNGCIKEACLGGMKNNFNIILISDAHSTFNKNADKIISNINDELKAQGAILKLCSEL